MKNNSTIVLSLLMIGFSLIAMPTYANAEPDSYYGVPYSYNNEQDSYYGEKDSYNNEQDSYYGEKDSYYGEKDSYNNEQDSYYGEKDSYNKDPNKFLDIKNTKIGKHDDIIKKIFFETRGEIPEDGSEGAFGYGVVTLVDDTFNVIATTTHEGFYDSELQKLSGNIYSPVFHNHYVKLTPSELCKKAVGPLDPADPNSPGLAIADLTFESPGEVNIVDNKAILTNLPKTADTLLFNPNEKITPGSDIQLVASFRLVPLNDIVNPLVVDLDPLKAVCIADVQPAENVEPLDLFRDNFNNHYYNEGPEF